MDPNVNRAGVEEAFNKQLEDIKGKLDGNPYTQLYLLGYNDGFTRGAIAGSIAGVIAHTIILRFLPK